MLFSAVKKLEQADPEKIVGFIEQKMSSAGTLECLSPSPKSNANVLSFRTLQQRADVWGPTRHTDRTADLKTTGSCAVQRGNTGSSGLFSIHMYFCFRCRFFKYSFQIRTFSAQERRHIKRSVRRDKLPRSLRPKEEEN